MFNLFLIVNILSVYQTAESKCNFIKNNSGVNFELVL